MSQTHHPHRDCRNFAPVDVAKGICHRTKEMIPADGEACRDFDRIPKCRWCANFQADPGTVEMGTCGASAGTSQFMAYPDMVAVTCEMYQNG
jgi:4-hydroxyphenylacetate decarboxylase small subunit